MHEDQIRPVYAACAAKPEDLPEPGTSSTGHSLPSPWAITVSYEDFLGSMLKYAVDYSLVFLTRGVELLDIQYVPTHCQGSPNKRTTVLQVVAKDDIPAKGIVLVPGGGSIAETPADKG